MFNVKRLIFNVHHEEGNLEIHHSDRCGHTDRHRHQPWSYQLYVMGEPTPSPSQEEGNKKEDEQHCSSSFFVTTSA